jgi:hypothetical protein
VLGGAGTGRDEVWNECNRLHPRGPQPLNERKQLVAMVA